MPLFFSLSGFLFYKSISKNGSALHWGNFWSYTKKKFFRLMVPYFIIAFIWMDPIKYIVGFYECLDEHLIASQLTGIGNGHLWFLYCLFVISLFSKILLKISYNWKSDILLLLIFVLLHLFNNLIPSVFALRQTSYYEVYFYCGYLFSKYVFLRHVLSIRMKVWLIIILWTIGTLINNYSETLSHGVLVKIASLVLCVSILWLIYNISFSKFYKSKFLNLISECSLGIYLLHSPLIYIIYSYYANLQPIFILILNFLVFGTISLLLTIFIKKSRLKMIIGEKRITEKSNKHT